MRVCRYAMPPLCVARAPAPCHDRLAILIDIRCRDITHAVPLRASFEAFLRVSCAEACGADVTPYESRAHRRR